MRWVGHGFAIPRCYRPSLDLQRQTRRQGRFCSRGPDLDTILTRSRLAERQGQAMMAQWSKEVGEPGRQAGIDAAASAKSGRADSLAPALASTIRVLVAAGFVSQHALANGLNREKYTGRSRR